MENSRKSKCFIAASTLLALGAATAYAGPDALRSTPAPAPMVPTAETITLSPAEIRNSVSIKMDELEWQGYSVDRSVVDGIGLDLVDRRTTEAGPL